SILLAEGLVFPDQLFAGRTSGVLVLNCVADLSGLIIDGLTTTADSTCLDGNGTANPAKTDSCIGDPKRNGYGAHGGGLRESEFVFCSHSDGPPPLLIKRNLAKRCQVSSSRTRICPVLGRCRFVGRFFDDRWARTACCSVNPE